MPLPHYIPQGKPSSYYHFSSLLFASNKPVPFQNQIPFWKQFLEMIQSDRIFAPFFQV